MYATIGKDGKYTGTVYGELTQNVIDYHEQNGLTWVEVDTQLENIGTDEDPDYGAPTAEEIEAQQHRNFRSGRDSLLAEADIEIFKLEDAGQDATAWREYRRALRDATEAWVLPPKPTEG